VTFKPWVPVANNYGVERTLQRLCRKAGLKPQAYLDRDTRVFIYDASSFTGQRGGQVVDLHRGRPLVTQETLTGPFFHERLALAGAWFHTHCNPSTKLLAYQYHPAKDSYLKSDNHVRRLASAWAMARLANVTGQQTALGPAIEATLEHYRRLTKLEAHGGLVVEIDREAPIAHSAFLLLALAEWDQAPQREQLIRQLAQGLLHQQNEDGAYRTSFGQSDTKRGIDYYPGEAMLALMRAHQLLKESAHLASVEMAFPYYRRYWRDHRTTAFVPWQAQVNLLLYQTTQQGRYAAFTFEMADWLIDNYQIHAGARPDELGGFGIGNARQPGNSSASFLEGVNAAYRLAVLTGDSSHAEKYAVSIRMGTRFVLQTQVTEEYAMLLKRPERALGGFTQTLTRNVQRSDYTQHAVMALLAALENGGVLSGQPEGSKR
jgi:hypothetical protein